MFSVWYCQFDVSPVNYSDSDRKRNFYRFVRFTFHVMYKVLNYAKSIHNYG